MAARVNSDTSAGGKNGVVVNDRCRKDEASIESEEGVRIVVTRIALDVNVKLKHGAVYSFVLY